MAGLSFDSNMASTSNEKGAITLATLEKMSLSPEEMADIELRQEGTGGVTDLRRARQKFNAIGYTCNSTYACSHATKDTILGYRRHRPLVRKRQEPILSKRL